MQVIYVGGLCRWSMQIVCVDGLCRWWSMQVICVEAMVYVGGLCRAHGLCRWSMQMDCVDGLCRWSVQVVCADGLCRWWFVQVRVDGQCCLCHVFFVFCSRLSFHSTLLMVGGVLNTGSESQTPSLIHPPKVSPSNQTRNVILHHKCSYGAISKTATVVSGKVQHYGDRYGDMYQRLDDSCHQIVGSYT